MKTRIDTIQTNFSRFNGELNYNDGAAMANIIQLPLECRYIDEIGVFPVYNDENVLTESKYISLTLNDSVHILDDVVVGSCKSKLITMSNLMKKVALATPENSFIKVTALSITNQIKTNSSIKVIMKWR